MEWPEGEVRVDGIEDSRVRSVALLGFEGPVEWRQEGGSFYFSPPLMSPADVPSPYAYVFKIDGALR